MWVGRAKAANADIMKQATWSKQNENISLLEFELETLDSDSCARRRPLTGQGHWAPASARGSAEPVRVYRPAGGHSGVPALGIWRTSGPANLMWLQR